MASGGLVVVVLQYSRLLELSLSRDRLSVNLVPLILRLAYGSFPNANRGLDGLDSSCNKGLAPTVASLFHGGPMLDHDTPLERA